MEKNNNLIVAQAFIMLCALALPFISLYCQEKSPRQLSANQRVTRTQSSTRGQRVITRRSATKRKPTTKRAPSTDEPAAVQATDNMPTTEDAEVSSDEVPNQPTQATSGTKQVQAGTTMPSSWYSRFAPLLLASLYKGSETGIGALTKTLVKLFIVRRNTLREKEELEVTKKEFEEEKSFVTYLLTEKGKNELTALSTEEQVIIKDAIKNTHKKEIDILTEEDKLGKLEKQTSLYSIVATGAFMVMLNTAVPMMGTLMGTAVQIGLQMLMPVDNS